MFRTFGVLFGCVAPKSNRSTTLTYSQAGDYKGQHY
mgnify:FL=1